MTISLETTQSQYFQQHGRLSAHLTTTATLTPDKHGIIFLVRKRQQ